MSIKIGFTTKPFPVVEGSKAAKKVYAITHGSHKVYVEVWQCNLSLSEDVTFPGVVTSRTSVRFNGWGQHEHVDEAEVLVKAVEQYCRECGIQLCATYCNWPIFRGAVNIKNKYTMKDEHEDFDLVPNSSDIGNPVERVFLVPEKGDILTVYGSEEVFTVVDFPSPYLTVNTIDKSGEAVSFVMSGIDTINNEIVID